MGFKKVYDSLREIFPQVDTRILRAVAIEHAKDVEAAVMDVVTEVIPFISKKAALPPQDICHEFPLKGEDKNTMEMDSSSCKQMAAEAHIGLVESGILGGEAFNDTAEKSDLFHSDAAHLDQVLKRFVSLTNVVSNNVCKRSHGHTETTSLEIPAKSQEDNVKVGLDHVALLTLNDLLHEDGGCDDHEQINESAEDLEHNSSCNDEDFNQEEKDVSLLIKSWLINESEVNDDNVIVSQKIHCTELHADNSFLEAENSDSQIDNPSLENHAPVLPIIHLHLESDYQKPNASGSSNPSPKQDCSTGELSVIEDGLMENTMLTQSGQLCRIDLLDGIIEDAKSNKITLFSAMESVLNKMRELEEKEKAVEKAKEEAANGGSDILVKVEELKQMVAHTKETNDMHAGEVYGEKAILATEAKELQSRLLSLSDERDRSLSILDEMHETLEARIAAADAMQKADQEEKLAKAECARKSLAEQEALLEKVVHETAILRQEAEENTKLREFLIDRGRIVDTLQGEISVICKDVRQLKEKFDERVPLSKSLSSSLLTSCILASSGSSLKSLSSDLARSFLSQNDAPSDFTTDQAPLSESLKKESPESSVNCESTRCDEEEKARSDHKANSDDEWEVFDKDAELAESPWVQD